MAKEKIANKKETFMQGVVTIMFSQILIKVLGLIYTLYLTNREGLRCRKCNICKWISNICIITYSIVNRCTKCDIKASI